MRQMIIAGNWKCFGTINETKLLLDDLLKAELPSDDCKVVVCPPFTALSTACKMLGSSMIAVGGQDMSEHSGGAYTSEISAEMLLTVGATFVILGHSERRQYHHESDQVVNAKSRVAISSGLTPIICVGETLEEREAGRTEDVISSQLSGSIDKFSPDDLKKIVIAYEPVWAIGTGRTATPEMAEAVHGFIRNRLTCIDKKAAEVLPILYGGSVKPENAAGLMSQPNIDGALVGGASLKALDFISIINAARVAV